MPTLAAIDVGSNALRLAVGSVDSDRRLDLLEVVRESVRLGHDVFTGGTIAEGTIDRTVDAFKRFRETMDRHGVRWSRAVATSAVREALNSELFLDRILQGSGVEVEAIDAQEEARLIHMAVGSRLKLQGRMALLVDIGGGSTEITLASDEGILSTESYTMGSVRLLRLMGEGGGSEQDVIRLIQEYVDATQRRIRREIGTRTVDLCIGTGGNLETLADLRRDLLGKERTGSISTDELDLVIRRLTEMTYEERVADLRLRPDRADVIIPASIIIRKIATVAGVQEILIPGVGLKDGLLLDMVEELYGDRRALRREQVIAAALQMGRKYQFDEQHALSVARFAVQLFDQTRELHHLGLEHRLLLEVAALLHDVGNFIAASDHHKHTQYLLMATPVVGLVHAQMVLVANIARYHRKSLPKMQHESYRALSAKERVLVSKLAALLRLADALDNEHASKVTHFAVEYKKPRLTMRIYGEGDLMLEKWALARKANMFEEVFSVRFSLAT